MRVRLPHRATRSRCHFQAVPWPAETHAARIKQLVAMLACGRTVHSPKVKLDQPP